MYENIAVCLLSDDAVHNYATVDLSIFTQHEYTHTYNIMKAQNEHSD